jgi:hypothetical protein
MLHLRSLYDTQGHGALIYYMNYGNVRNGVSVCKWYWLLPSCVELPGWLVWMALAHDQPSRPRHSLLLQPLTPRVFCTSDLLRNRTHHLH